MMNVDIRIPDFSSIAKRSGSLPCLIAGKQVIVDSTGLKVYGKDEWHQEKCQVSPRRT